MPILTQPVSRSPRRRPWLWVLLAVPGLVFLLMAGLVGWSWFRPVKLAYGECEVAFGRCFTPGIPGAPESGPGWGQWRIKLSGEEPPAWYFVVWSWF